MTLTEARAKAIRLSREGVQHVTVTIRPVATHADGTAVGYFIDPSGFGVSDWLDGSVIETYEMGHRK